jgi:hypothetical protein
MRRKHRQSSTTTSSCVPRVEITNNTILPDVSLEPQRRVGEEPVTSPPKKRRQMSGMELSSQDIDRDWEVVYLRSELTKMTQRVEELTKDKRGAKKVRGDLNGDY